jgi:hypothetical protein
MNATADWCGGYCGRAVCAEAKLCSDKVVIDTNFKAGIRRGTAHKLLHCPALTSFLHNHGCND